MHTQQFYPKLFQYIYINCTNGHCLVGHRRGANTIVRFKLNSCCCSCHRHRLLHSPLKNATDCMQNYLVHTSPPPHRHHKHVPTANHTYLTDSFATLHLDIVHAMRTAYSAPHPAPPHSPRQHPRCRSAASGTLYGTLRAQRAHDREACICGILCQQKTSSYFIRHIRSSSSTHHTRPPHTMQCANICIYQLSKFSNNVRR